MEDAMSDQEGLSGLEARRLALLLPTPWHIDQDRETWRSEPWMTNVEASFGVGIADGAAVANLRSGAPATAPWATDGTGRERRTHAVWCPSRRSRSPAATAGSLRRR